MRTKSIWCLAAAAAVLSLSACKAEEKKAITIGIFQDREKRIYKDHHYCRFGTDSNEDYGNRQQSQAGNGLHQIRNS